MNVDVKKVMYPDVKQVGLILLTLLNEQFTLDDTAQDIKNGHLNPLGETALLTKWDNYKVIDEKPVHLFLTIKLYFSLDFINLWIDKLWEGESMGNGFIHKSLRNTDDLFAILQVINMALPYANVLDKLVETNE
jgi:hypothetical protein